MLALHIGGAFFHQFIIRDGLLSRMGWGAVMPTESDDSDYGQSKKVPAGSRS
jgi:hypothetical protein